MATSRPTGERLLAHDELLTWAGYPVTARMPYMSAVSIFRGWLQEAGQLRWPWQRGRRALLEREAWRLFDAFVETGQRRQLEVDYGVRPGTQELVLSSWSALVDGRARHLKRSPPDPHSFPAIVRSKGWAAARQHAEAEHAELLRQHEAERRALETFTMRVRDADERYRSAKRVDTYRYRVGDAPDR